MVVGWSFRAKSKILQNFRKSENFINLYKIWSLEGGKWTKSQILCENLKRFSRCSDFAGKKLILCLSALKLRRNHRFRLQNAKSIFALELYAKWVILGEITDFARKSYVDFREKWPFLADFGGIWWFRLPRLAQNGSKLGHFWFLKSRIGSRRRRGVGGLD